jgi:hypothetical protein
MACVMGAASSVPRRDVARVRTRLVQQQQQQQRQRQRLFGGSGSLRACAAPHVHACICWLVY